MEKFIPYEKLSKKEKRKLNAAKRGSWGGLDPVTRVPRNPRAYKRDKSWKREVPPVHDLFFLRVKAALFPLLLAFYRQIG